MNDPGGVSSVEPLGNLDAPIEQRFDVERAPGDAVFQRLAVEKLHGDEVPAFVFVNFVDRANVGMVQGRSSLRFALESFEGLAVLSQILRQKLQRDKTAELGVLGLVHHAHSTTAKFFKNAVMRDGPAVHVRGAIHEWHMLGCGQKQVNASEDLAKGARASRHCLGVWGAQSPARMWPSLSFFVRRYLRERRL